jgi:hypothetical protein
MLMAWAASTPGALPLTVRALQLPNLKPLELENCQICCSISESMQDIFSREANKLKVVADIWLAGKPAPHYPETDFSQPAFRPAGRDDLNALSAIASIGIALMEGQSEPAEIRMLKAKLGSLGDGSVRAGEWLAGMMASAWPRESVLLDDKFANVARARDRTIATTELTHLLVGEQRFALANNGSPWRTGFHFAGTCVNRIGSLETILSFPETTNAGRIIARNSEA